MPLLTKAQITDVMADCMADDVALLWPQMQRWTLDEVEAYFLSGGVKVPVDKALQDESHLIRSEAYPVAEQAAADETANPLWCCGGQWRNYAAQRNPAAQMNQTYIVDPAAGHADASSNLESSSAKLPKFSGVPMDRRSNSMDAFNSPKVRGVPMDRRAISMDNLSSRSAVEGDIKPALLAPAAAAVTKRRPRLLCCHGSNSNAEATRYQAMLLGLDDLEPADARCHCVFIVRPAPAQRPPSARPAPTSALRPPRHHHCSLLPPCFPTNVWLTPPTLVPFGGRFLPPTGRAVQGGQVRLAARERRPGVVCGGRADRGGVAQDRLPL